MTVKPLEMENCILAGSTSGGISEDPATGPALSKGNSFFDDDEDDEGNSGSSSSSLWDD